MVVIWEDLPQQIDIINKTLQEPSIELSTVTKLYYSLIKHFNDIRDRFQIIFESIAKNLTIVQLQKSHPIIVLVRKQFDYLKERFCIFLDRSL